MEMLEVAFRSQRPLPALGTVMGLPPQGLHKVFTPLFLPFSLWEQTCVYLWYGELFFTALKFSSCGYPWLLRTALSFEFGCGSQVKIICYRI